MTNWWLDETDISTYAQNVENRSAGWGVAAKRGDNRRVPGRDGSRYRSKAYDEKTLIFNMWANGCLPDGSMPTDVTTRGQVVRNLDALTRAFTTEGQHKLIRPDDGVLYGRKNLIPNPSFENNDGQTKSAENTIINPSLEWTDGTYVIARKNFADNPSMEDGIRGTVYRENLVVNPSIISEDHAQVWRRNLITNPSFESQMNPWAGTSSSDIDRVNYSATGWPVTLGGRWSLKVTSLSSADSAAVSNPVKVKAGTFFAFQCQVLNKAGVSKDFKIRVTWRQKDGTFISNSFTSTTTLADGVVGLLSGGLNAPALANFCVVAPTMVSATVGQAFYIDQVLAESGSAINKFFNGNTAEIDGMRHRWINDAGNSISEEYMMFPLGWAPDADWGAFTFGITTSVYKSGSTCGRITAGLPLTLNTAMFRQQPNTACIVPPRTQCAGSISLRLHRSITSSRIVKGWLSCYDSDGTFLGRALQSGSNMPPSIVTLNPGEWTKVDIGWGTTRKGTASVAIAIDAGGAWSAGDTVYFDEGLVELGKVSGDYFDGNTSSDDVWEYDWSDEPGNSSSRQLGYQVVGWQPGIDCSLVRVQNEKTYYGANCLRLIVPGNPTTLLPYGLTSPLDLDGVGNSHTASIWVRPSRTMNQEIAISYDNGDTWTAANASCTIAVWTRISVTATAPITETSPNEVLIRVGYLQGTTTYAVDGDTVDFDGLLFEADNTLMPFFSGDSGENYYWLDDPYHSTSVAQLEKAVGFVPYLTDPAIYRQLQNSDTGVQAAQEGKYFGTCLSPHRGQYGITMGSSEVIAGNQYSFGIALRPYVVSMDAIVGISWFDATGTLISTSQTTVTCASTSAWQRCTITATAPALALSGAPFASDSQTNTSVTGFDFDQANFGFGTDSTYHDGDSGGWYWDGEKDQSASSQTASAVAFWSSTTETLTRSSTWDASRGHSGRVAASGSVGARVFAENYGKGSGTRFQLPPTNPDKSYVWALHVKATIACQVKLAFVPCVWNGTGWDPGIDPVVFGAVETYSAGQVRRISTVMSPSFIGGTATHFRPAVYFYSAAGGALTAGTFTYLDNALLSDYKDKSSTYQDGEDSWVKWLGDDDASASLCYGPSRVISVEVKDAIDMSSINGDLAKFSVNMIATDPFWADPETLTKTFTIPRSGAIIDLTHLRGNTAKIPGAIISVNGPLNDFTLTDLGSGAWFHIKSDLSDNEWCIIHNSTFRVENAHGVSMISLMTHDGDAYLLPLTNEAGYSSPRLQITSHAVGAGAKITVAARRRFHVA